MKAQTVSIIGLNRIGASVGLALRQSKLGLSVIGHDVNGDLIQRAKEMEAIEKGEWNLVNAAAAADILILSLPALDLEASLQAIGRDVQSHTLILDLGYVKQSGLKWADKYLKQGHYVGASPVLAAAALTDGRLGIEGARADLFRQSVFCYMPSVKAEPKAVETAVNLGMVLGAKPFFVDAGEFDSLVQGVNTVPGLLSAALFQAVTRGNGWRDMLRFAGLPFAFSTVALSEQDVAQRVFQDQAATLRWLDAVIEELKGMRRLVAQGDREEVAILLQQLDIERDTWLRRRTENEWEEYEAPEITSRSLAETLLGGLARKRDDKKE
jgi:prephenate dehydrogenase